MDYNLAAHFCLLTIKTISMTNSKTHIYIDTYRRIICWRGLKWLKLVPPWYLGGKSRYQCCYIMNNNTVHVVIFTNIPLCETQEWLRNQDCLFVVPNPSICTLLCACEGEEMGRRKACWIGIYPFSFLSSCLFSFNAYLDFVFPHVWMFVI